MFTTKDHVLSALIRAEGHISGEAVSGSLGISRAAVNTAVKALRSDGYVIESSTKKGYILTKDANMLNAGSLMAHTGEERMKDIICLDSVDSTNRYLKDLAFDGVPHGTVVIAEMQTKGRGRLGRSFLSPKGKGLYMSYLVHPSMTNKKISDLTSVAAVAVCRAIGKAAGIDPGIKWVNDIVINGRKICGILTELTIESESGHIDNAVIGIGININEKEEDFPDEIRDVAGSLIQSQSDPSVSEIRRADIASELIYQLDLLLSDDTSREEILDLYRRSCITVGQQISAVKVHDTGDVRHGKALAVNDDFSLKVEFEDGSVEDLISGEVSIRGMYGYV